MCVCWWRKCVSCSSALSPAPVAGIENISHLSESAAAPMTPAPAPLPPSHPFVSSSPLSAEAAASPSLPTPKTGPASPGKLLKATAFKSSACKPPCPPTLFVPQGFLFFPPLISNQYSFFVLFLLFAEIQISQDICSY